MPKPNVHIRKGDGFHYAVSTAEPSKTLMRSKTHKGLRSKLIKAGHSIIPESVGDFLEEVWGDPYNPKHDHLGDPNDPKNPYTNADLPRDPKKHGLSKKALKRKKKAADLIEDEYTSIYSERNDNPRPSNPYARGERAMDMPRADRVLVASPSTFADLKIGERFMWGVNQHREHGRDVMVKVGHNDVLNKSLSDAGSWLDDENMYMRTLQSLGRSPLDPVEPIVAPAKQPAMPQSESQRLAKDLIEGRDTSHLKQFQFKKKGKGEDKEKPAKSGTEKVGGSKEGGMAKAATGTGKMQQAPKEDHETDYMMGKKKEDGGPRETKEPKKGDTPKSMGGSSTECSGVSEDASNVVDRMLDEGAWHDTSNAYADTDPTYGNRMPELDSGEDSRLRNSHMERSIKKVKVAAYPDLKEARVMLAHLRASGLNPFLGEGNSILLPQTELAAYRRMRYGRQSARMESLLETATFTLSEDELHRACLSERKNASELLALVH